MYPYARANLSESAIQTRRVDTYLAAGTKLMSILLGYLTTNNYEGAILKKDLWEVNNCSIRGTAKSYKDLKRAYQIAILAKERFFADEIFIHIFEYIQLN